jgi:hypothetical protein
MAIINGPYPDFSCALHGLFVTAQISHGCAEAQLRNPGRGEVLYDFLIWCLMMNN